MIYSDYAPNVVEINSLGIGLLNYSNIELLDLNNNEFLVVGQQNNTGATTKDIKYSMIVNRDSVAINATRRDIDAAYENSSKSHGLYVGQDIICNGNIIAKGLQFSDVKFDGFNSNILEDILTSVNNINPLFYKGYGIVDDSDENRPIAIDNIYTPSYVTIGGISDTYNNAHPLNITTTANDDLNNVHIAIQNNIDSGTGEPAKFRLGMVGDTAVSPAVISTTRGMPIEFHPSRTTAEINSLYSGGDRTGVPNYVLHPNLVPSLILDTQGSVGIGTNIISDITYTKYTRSNDLEITQRTVTELPKIKVDGTAQIKNIVTYDYYSKSNLSLDDIYVRRAGLTIKSDNIIPGDFMKGEFTFNSNLYVGKTGDSYSLNVNDVLNVNGDLHVDRSTVLHDLNVKNIATFDRETNFENDIYIRRDVTLGRNIAINDGNLFIANKRIYVSELHPIMVDAEIAAASNINGSNILIYASSDVLSFVDASNFIVPGRLGVGVLQSDEYNEQLNIIKHRQNIFELMLQDSSEADTKAVVPMVYMGHLASLDDKNYVQDRSFIINTNDTNELHNIYFFPGVDLNRNRTDTIPTLAINQNNRIGINTDDPRHTLDVKGEILCNDIYINRNNIASKAGIFVLKPDAYAALGDNTGDFYYMYDPTGVNKYCINFTDKTGIKLKGFNVKGGIHAVSEGYYEDNTKLANLKITDATERSAYTNKNVIIGWNEADLNIGSMPLNIRNLSTKNFNDTIIRLYRGPRVGAAFNSAKYTGIDICDYNTPPIIQSQQPAYYDRNLYKWFMYKNHVNDVDLSSVGPLQFGYTDGTQHPKHFGMTMYYNKQTCNYHVDINNPKINTDLTNRKNAMAIYGNLDVYGSINLIGTSNTYKINGINVSQNALQSLIPRIDSSLGSSESGENSPNDVVITGQKVAIMPQKTLAIGHLEPSLVNHLSELGKNDRVYNVPLTVYQSVQNNPTVSSFYTCYDRYQNLNSAAIDLGLFDISDSDYTGKKKAAVEFKISNYAAMDSSKSLFELSMYNESISQNDKVFSVYRDGYATYFNLGGTSSMHDQQSGAIFTGELTNIGLHVDNVSKYLLQLTNTIRSPAINMHRSTTDSDKFWIIEAPNDDGNFAIKHANATDAYVPPDQDIYTSFVITENNKFGFNVPDPVYSIDLKSANDTASIHLTNKYSEISLSDKYVTVEVINSNLEYEIMEKYNYARQNSSYLYSYNSTSNTYFSGIKYLMPQEALPSKDINGMHLPLNYISSSNFVKTTKKYVNNVFNVTTYNDLIVRNNNNNIILTNSDYMVTSNVESDAINIDLTNDISILPSVPTVSGAILTINPEKILVQNVDRSYTNSGVFEVPINYNYGHTYEIIGSNARYFSYDIVDSTMSVTNNKLKTSNLIRVIFEKNQATTETTRSVVKKNTVQFEYNSDTYENEIVTTYELKYKSTDTYDLDLIAQIDKYFNFYSEVEGPHSIIKDVISNAYDVSTYKLNRTSNIVDIISTTSFLKEVPYGAYEGFSFEDNIESMSISSTPYKLTYNVNVLSNNFQHTLYIDDRYTVYDFQENIRPFRISLHVIDFQPHIIFNNSIDFVDTNDVQFGKTNKIYSKNGSIDIMSEDNVLMTITDQGDVKVDGTVYTNTVRVQNVIVDGNIYDRLGNSMIFNYSEDMYNQAFVMQSSNYILYTSNYSITSSSNIDFRLTGRDNTGVSIYKYASDMYHDDGVPNDYNLFRIMEDDVAAFSVGNGGRVGIKVEHPQYDLDIAGDMSVDDVYARRLFGDGANLYNVNLIDRNTNMLEEGSSNLYFTSSRVSMILDASNIDTCNYIDRIHSNLVQASNLISERITALNIDMSNYVDLVHSNLVDTSNIISERITILNTDMSNYIDNLTADDIYDGQIHRFIVNNMFDNLTLTGNLRIDGNLTVLGDKVILIPQEQVSTSVVISGVTNQQSLIIDRPDKHIDIMSVSNYILNNVVRLITMTSNETIVNEDGTESIIEVEYTKSSNFESRDNFDPDILNITYTGKIGMGTYPDNFGPYRLTVVGNMSADYLYGDGANLYNVNLSDRDTDMLAEGSDNLYFRNDRVSVILDASNIDTCNYISFVNSNLGNLDTRVTQLNIDMSNYVDSIHSNVVLSSNLISERITTLNIDMSNYVDIVNSNAVMTSNLISQRITTLNVDISNYVYNVHSNAVLASNLISERITVLNTDMSNYVDSVHSNLKTVSNKVDRAILYDEKNTDSKRLIVNEFIDTDGEAYSYDFNSKLYVRDLEVYGQNTIIQTNTYRTENLEILVEESTYDGPGLKITMNHDIGNFVELIRGDENLLTIYNWGGISIGGAALADNRLAINGDVRVVGNIFTSTGNIGIGKYPDNAELDINGSIKFTGSINTVSATELEYVKNVTSPIQTQLNDIDSNASNYISDVYDTVISDIDDLGSDVSNFVIQTSNNISKRIDDIVDSGILSQWKNKNSNIYYYGRISVGTSNVSSVNRAEIYDGDVNITYGSIKQTIPATEHPLILLNSLQLADTRIADTTDHYFAFTDSSTPYSVRFARDTICELFMIGGGGSGGGNIGGGGGAGAYYYTNKYIFAAGDYKFYVGIGGENGQNGGDTYIEQNGHDLVIFGQSLRCYGGGAGGTSTNIYASDGGSGGGGFGSSNVDGYIAGGSAVNIGTVGFGNTGGYGMYQSINYELSEMSTIYAAGGGGGGINSAGQNASNIIKDLTYTYEAGNGGSAKIFTIKGFEEAYGGGGGASEQNDTSTSSGEAGYGGGVLVNNVFVKVGGDGVKMDDNGRDAVPNTGSGGGGGGYNYPGGKGGSGVIIIRYTITNEVVEYYGLERWKSSQNYNTMPRKYITYTDGNVGIGTNDPKQYNLNVSGNMLASNLTVSDITASNLQVQGNVGINMSPDSMHKLAVNGSILVNDIVCQNDINVAGNMFTSNIKCQTNISIGGTHVARALVHLQNSNFDNYIKIDAGTDKLSGLMLCKHDQNEGQIIRYDSVSSNLAFGSQISNGQFMNHMTLTRSGILGIGVDNVDENGSRLHVGGRLLIDSNDSGEPVNGIVGGTGTRIVIQKGSTSTVSHALGITSDSLWYSVPSGNYYHKFYNGSSVIMSIGNSNVGIGTVAIEANSKLHVYGKLLVEDSAIGDPSLGTMGDNAGTRVVLSKGSATLPPYALGVNTDSLWYSVPENISHSFYVNRNHLLSIKHYDNGILGIGTSDPKQILHIQNRTSNNYIKVDAGVGKYGGIMFTEHDSNNGHVIRYNSVSSNLEFAIQRNTNQMINYMTITSNGNIGIRSDKPAYTFDVNGSINCTDGFRINGELLTPKPYVKDIRDTSNLFNNLQNPSNTYTTFNNIPYFGFWYIDQPPKNADHPKVATPDGPLSATQGYYTTAQGSGGTWKDNEALQYAVARDVTNPYMNVRFKESGSFRPWTKISAGYADTAGKLSSNITINGVAFDGTKSIIVSDTSEKWSSTNLVAWYKFDSESDLLKDSSGNGYTLSKSEYSDLIFDSTQRSTPSSYGSIKIINSGHLALPSSLDLYSIYTSGGGITISFWFKIIANAEQQVILYFSNKELWNQYNITIMISPYSDESFRLLFMIYNQPSINSHTSEIILNLNTWNHISWSITNFATKSWDIFINNIKDASFSIIPDSENNIVFGIPNIIYDIMWLGRDYWHVMNGYIDDFRIYNKPLTDQEVNDIYQDKYTHDLYTASGLAVGRSNLEWQYKFAVEGNAYFTNSIITSNVGIGTDSIRSGYRLHVDGNTYMPAMLYASNIGIGTETVTPGYRLHVDGNTYMSGSMKSMQNLFASNIGIGTESVTPGYRLHVDGNTYMSGSLKSTKNLFASNISIGTDTILSGYRFNVDGNTYMSGSLKSMQNLLSSNIGIGTDSIRSGYRMHILGDAYVDGTLRASGDVMSSFSDMRMKSIIANIDSPIDKLMQINTFKYIPNDLALEMNAVQTRDKNKISLGVSAQDVQSVLPELVSIAPFDTEIMNDGNLVSRSGSNFLTVSYERMVPLLIECIKELKKEIDDLKKRVI